MDGQKAPGTLKLMSAIFFGRKIKVPYTLEDMASDSIEVLNALKIDEAHIVGASMGGMISQILTASHPERVLSLTSIMSSSGRGRLPKPKRSVLKQMFLGRPAKDDKMKKPCIRWSKRFMSVAITNRDFFVKLRLSLLMAIGLSI